MVEWIEPAALPSKIDLQPRANGESHETLLRLMSLVIRYSVKTGNPRFVNQLYSSLDPYGLVGQWLTDALNPSVYTYEVSPVFSLMEETVLREMRAIIGWKVRIFTLSLLAFYLSETHKLKNLFRMVKGMVFSVLVVQWPMVTPSIWPDT